MIGGGNHFKRAAAPAAPFQGVRFMELMQWLTDTMAGEFTLTILVSMIPVVELRGGIPFGVAAGLPVWAAFLAAVIGNLIPVPFIIVYIRRIFQWMRRRLPSPCPAPGRGPALWRRRFWICRCAAPSRR